MSPGRLRISVVAGTRRVDLAVPDAVPLAELVPVFASYLLDEEVADLSVQTLFGAALAPDLGLRAQQVRDGDLLTLAVAVDEPPPFVHDDVATAVRSSLEAAPYARPQQGLRTGLAVVVVLTAMSRLAEHAVWWSALGLALTVALALPHLAATWLVARSAGPSEAAALAVRARHLLCEGRAAALVVLASAAAVAGTAVWR